MSFFRALLLSVLFAFGSSAVAEDLAPPDGPVLLSVSGEITHTNSAGKAQFDLAMLKELPTETFETATIWTEGVQEFSGVSLAALLEKLGVDGTRLIASAINDYKVEIPVADAVEGGPIVAYNRNGTEMSVRDKGPLWIVYPYDLNADYRTETIYSRSIWQLDRIEVVN